MPTYFQNTMNHTIGKLWARNSISKQKTRWKKTHRHKTTTHTQNHKSEAALLKPGKGKGGKLSQEMPILKEQVFLNINLVTKN